MRFQCWGNLVGIITAFDLMQVAEIVDSENFTPLGAGAKDDVRFYDNTSAFVIVTKNLTFPRDRLVEEIMTKDVETVHVDSSLRDVSSKFKVQDIDLCPFTDAKENFLGIITDRELLRASIGTVN